MRMMRSRVAAAAAMTMVLFGAPAMAQQQGALGVAVVDSQMAAPGAYVDTVAPGSAAASGGILPSDVITALDGKPIHAASDLIQALAGHHPGDVITLHVIHYGQLPGKDLRLTLGTAVARTAPASAAPPQQATNPSVPAASMRWVRYADPAEHAFTIDVPAGWRVSGGSRRMSTLEIRTGIEAVSPDNTIDLFYGDLNVPIFTVPSPMLAAGGFRPGMVYSPGYGQQMLIEPYLAGDTFAAQWGAERIGRDCAGVQGSGARARPDASQAIDMAYAQGGVRTSIRAGEASFTCNLRGAPGVGYVFAGTELVQTQVSSLWDVKSLAGFAAAAPQAATAYALLGHMVASFAVDPAWAARQQQTAAQTSRIVAQTNAVVSNAIVQNGRNQQSISDMIVQGGAARSNATTNAIENYDEKAVRGTSTYVNPNTGATQTLNNDVAHQYQLPGGNGTIGTNSENLPGPGAQELQRVPAGQ